MVFTGWPHTRRGLAEVECVEHHRPVNLSQYATLDLHSQQQRSQSPLKKSVNLAWNEEFVFHVNDATHDLVITLWNHDKPTRDYVIGEL
jgi:hypothetical protein